MTHTPNTGTEPSEREQAEQCFAERLGSATPELSVLEAIYHELRHGNDQVQREIEALAQHSAALDEHADAMDGLKRSMYYEGDMHGRH